MFFLCLQYQPDYVLRRCWIKLIITVLTLHISQQNFTHKTALSIFHTWYMNLYLHVIPDYLGTLKKKKIKKKKKKKNLFWLYFVSFKPQSHRGKDRSPTFLQPLKTSVRQLVVRGCRKVFWSLQKVVTGCYRFWSAGGFAAKSKTFCRPNWSVGFPGLYYWATVCGLVADLFQMDRFSRNIMNMYELLYMHNNSILPVLAWSHTRKDQSTTFLKPLTIFVWQLVVRGRKMVFWTGRLSVVGDRLLKHFWSPWGFRFIISFSSHVPFADHTGR